MKIFNGNITTEGCRRDTAREWANLTEGKKIELLDHKTTTTQNDRIIQSIIYRIVDEEN